MNRPFGLLLTLTALSQTLSAQTSNSGPQLYSSSTSFHVPIESRSTYENWLKTKARSFWEARMKEDASLKYVLATRVIYGGVQEPEANAFVSVAVEGVPNNIGPMQDKLAKQVFGKTYEEFMSEADHYRKRLGQTLSTRIVGTGMAVGEGDIIRLDFKRITPGRTQDYVQLERDYLRLREAQVKSGTMKSWSMYALVLPGGTEHEYDAFTAHVGKDLEQVLTWGRGTSEIAAKLDPPFNLTNAAFRANDVAKTIRAEARLAVMVVRRP